MASRKKKYIKILVKGLEWTVYAQSNSSYIRNHGKDSGAITYIPNREMYFNIDHYNPNYAFHELLHAFVASSGTTSSGLDADQMEELCAEIISEHYYELGDLQNKITTLILK